MAVAVQSRAEQNEGKHVKGSYKNCVRRAQWWNAENERRFKGGRQGLDWAAELAAELMPARLCLSVSAAKPFQPSESPLMDGGWR